MLTKVISGGQIGVDRAALRAAKTVGLSTGGAMPLGFRIDDGPRPDYATTYGMRELPTPGYPPRTRQNVADADVTLILCFRASSGVGLTARAARELCKPFWWINANCDAGSMTVTTCAFHAVIDNAVPHKGKPQEIADLVTFLKSDSVSSLNVAGNRTTDEAVVEAWLTALFTQVLCETAAQRPEK